MLNILTKYSLIAILLILFSCAKEDDYDKYQISVTAKDTITIKYYNGIDTLTRKQLYHFSTAFIIYDNRLPYICIKGTIYTFHIYQNGSDVTHLYKELVATCNKHGLIHRFGESKFSRVLH